MNNAELINNAKKHIGLKLLKTLVPDIKANKKTPYIEYFITNDKSKLLNILNCCVANKKNEMFVLEVMKKGEDFNIDKLTEFFNKKPKYNLPDGKILNFNLFLGDNHVLKIRAHSEVKVKRAADAETLVLKSWEYRSPFNISCIVHPDENLIEIKTGSETKTNLVKEFLENEFFKEKDAIKKHIFEINHLKKVDEKTKPKVGEVTLTNFPGLGKIKLEGNNIEHAINILKSRNGLDLYKMGEVSLSVYEPNNLPIIFHPNGRISYKKFDGDIYKDVILAILR